jgi:hypothetical protein
MAHSRLCAVVNVDVMLAAGSLMTMQCETEFNGMGGGDGGRRMTLIGPTASNIAAVKSLELSPRISEYRTGGGLRYVREYQARWS